MKQIMTRMDWGDASDFVTFGNVSASCVDDAAYYVLVAPQNVVGNTIMTPLLEMVGFCASACRSKISHFILLTKMSGKNCVRAVSHWRNRIHHANLPL